MTTMKPLSALTALVLMASLGACASLQGPTVPANGETISYSVGPCFGFCPVYNVTVTPDGHVAFEGERHTATLGRQETDGGAKAYKTISATLTAYRPATGTTADTQCESRMSDQQHYRITWTAADGTQTVLQHDKGCRSAKNDALNKALETLPSKLGIADWVKQTTRPGVGRG
jgi:hypothetical protein